LPRDSRNALCPADGGPPEVDAGLFELPSPRLSRSTHADMPIILIALIDYLEIGKNREGWFPWGYALQDIPRE
jgi:hypothetical protein